MSSQKKAVFFSDFHYGFRSSYSIVLDGKSSLLFSCYVTEVFLMMLSVIFLSMVMILLSKLDLIEILVFDSSLSWLLNSYMTYETLEAGVGSGLFTAMLAKPNLFHLIVRITLWYYFAKMDGPVLDEKLFFEMVGLPLSNRLD